MTSRLIETGHGAYEISTDPRRVDVQAVHHFLSTDGYWSVGRSLEVVETSIANSSLVCGAYAADGTLVGFARIAHGLYEKLGFQPLESGTNWMERRAKSA